MEQTQALEFLKSIIPEAVIQEAVYQYMERNTSITKLRRIGMLEAGQRLLYTGSDSSIKTNARKELEHIIRKRNNENGIPYVTSEDFDKYLRQEGK